MIAVRSTCARRCRPTESIAVVALRLYGQRPVEEPRMGALRRDLPYLGLAARRSLRGSGGADPRGGHGLPAGTGVAAVHVLPRRRTVDAALLHGLRGRCG